MSWNGYPSYVCNVILRKLREQKKNTNRHCSNSEDDDTPKIWFRVPYIGPIGEKFAKKMYFETSKMFQERTEIYSYVWYEESCILLL